jgi:GNAT superfamily N-acetyltransferase
MNWMEWVGYLASALILISLLMSSIIKLRWINLTGSLIFCIYGFLIGALPVGISNLAIMGINIYYLIRIYSAKDYFTIMPIEKGSAYLDYFLSYYKTDIEKYFPAGEISFLEDGIQLFILRNLVPAGIFMALWQPENSLLVKLDFAIPEYRDFKIGRYLFEERKQYFLAMGVDTIQSRATNKMHEKYLRKMGFEKQHRENDIFYIKKLQ